MIIGIVGLGLIGGSFAKAIKKYTDHTVLAYDASERVMSFAEYCKAYDGRLEDRIHECDMIISALYPKTTVEYIKGIADNIKKGAIVTDCGGVKSLVCNEIEPLAERYGFSFIGAHPMAGVEHSGFEYSDADMFSGASFVITPPKSCKLDDVDVLKNLALSIGFGKIQYATAQRHDKMIAFTSQLAHVVSGAYVKSPSALSHSGFSAGSFKDMTRVAKLNPDMWTELFLENKEYLAEEIDLICKHLSEYSKAIRLGDEKTLYKLLKDGSDIKQKTIEAELKSKQ